MGKHDLYYAAQRADAAYQRELERVYGKRRAGDMRYRKHSDSGVLAAREKKIVADMRYLEHAKHAREENPKKRRGSWPKGKTPPHLKKYLFK